MKKQKSENKIGVSLTTSIKEASAADGSAINHSASIGMAATETTSGARLLPIESIVEDPELKGMVGRKQEMIDAIAEGMKTDGFDPSQPLVVEGMQLVDGYTRWLAAIKAGLTHVWVVERQFDGRKAMKLYALERALIRRNLCEGDYLTLIPLYDEVYKMPVGKPPKSHNKLPAESAELIGTRLGIGRNKVYQVREIHRRGDDALRSKIIDGEVSINQAHSQLKANKTEKPKKSAKAPESVQDDVAGQQPSGGDVAGTSGVGQQPACGSEAEQVGAAERVATSDCSRFQRTNDMIGWANWSWNPVTGCRETCPYCYARPMSKRYKKAFPNGFEPTFHEYALDVPSSVPACLSKVPGGNLLFVCSMGELFGPWVEQAWIDRILGIVRANPQWGFVFLTKNPPRLTEIDWPANTVVGVTIDSQARVEASLRALHGLNQKRLEGFGPSAVFISCEPMLEDITFEAACDGVPGGINLKGVDWLMVGARSRSGSVLEMQPEPEWLAHAIRQAKACGTTIFLKENLHLRETPAQLLPKKEPETAEAEVADAEPAGTTAAA